MRRPSPTPSHRRPWIAMALALLFVLIQWSAAAQAREGIVKTRDGRTIQGDVTQADNGDVSINVRGVVMNLARADIESVEYPESFDTQYQQRLDALKANDAAGRLELARWAFDNQQYERAREAAQAAIDIDPNSADAVTMLETIRVQMRLEQNRQEPPPNADAQPSDDGQITQEPEDSADRSGSLDGVRRVERNLLTADDINRIRQLELKPNDDAVRVRFANDVERRFASTSNQDPGRFRNLRPVQKAIQILDDNDPDFTRDVHIMSDPSAMMEFRRLVQPLALNGCATTGCHGSSAGGKFILYSPAESEDITYTNFYILQQYRKPAAQGQNSVFGAGEHRMIDRSNPQDSLLLQYGLPADIAQVDHPPVRGLKPIFRNLQDPRYQQVVRWMNESLKPVDPDYGIDYQPPSAPPAPATTEPAPTEPAPTEPAATEDQPAEPAPAANE